MQYLLTVDPDKEAYFFHFLQSLQELGIIEDYVSIGQNEVVPSMEDIYAEKRSIETYSYDLSEQYRDLVD